MGKDDGKSECERRKKSDHEGIYVMERQRQKQPFIETVHPGGQQRLEIGQEVDVAQRHAFGPSADAGGVKQQGRLLSLYGRDRARRLPPEALPASGIVLVGIQ